MTNLSPNQFALPGMEHLAHPLARHLPNDMYFHAETEKEGGHTAKLGRSFEHRFEAYEGGAPTAAEAMGRYHPRRVAGLYWKGQSYENSSSGYPGEIGWVERSKADFDDPERPHKGLVTDMFRFAHQHPVGDTVPVHSPDRSPFGQRWAKKVGPPELVPKKGDDYYRPPAGIHPYEQAEPKERAREWRVDVIGPTRQQHFFDGAKYDRDPF